MSTKLINKSEVKNAIKVKGFAGDILASALMRILGLEKVNEIYSHIKPYWGIEFADKLIEHMNVTVDYIPDELEYLPVDQPFIIVSNHPFGAIDGIIMLSILGKKRPDLKILTNFILSYIPNLEDHFFPVNPFTDRPGMKSSLRGLKLAKEHLAAGGALGLFPSGEVSSDANKERVVKDIDWQNSIIKLIKGAKVPVVPLYFDGGNSRLFHLMGRVNPYLRTARLPYELFNKEGKTISFRIGKPIMPAEFEEFIDLTKMGKHLWNRTYALEANFAHSGVDIGDGKHVKQEIVAPHVEVDKLEKEIGTIASDKLFEVGDYECYLSDAKDIPFMMHEIGVCREETFRAVGEGTNNSIDIDKYDSYYKHLVLWDKVRKKLVGAYRFGMGDRIMEKYGIEGFYSNTLFRYKKDFSDYLSQAMELGRSFVVPDCQKDPLALMLLIKGIMYTLIKNPNIRYLIGPVSISAWYPYFYRSLMVHYLEARQSLPHLKKYVSPKTPFEPDYHRVNVDELMEGRMDSLERFDRFMFKLSNGSYRLPTLLKKYIKLNARILAFNVDPDFNYCVDGLIMVDALEIPKAEIDSLSKEFEDKQQLYKRFGIK